ncbi:class I SAM-dependent methyltransferase [Rhodanobacter sp. Col0626]|uniref:class I SAM-dependent methyltransferase n=1 Tax=Rhodanobacter sp. Col0626 TaxID=3415679 RepID=UPI003CF828F0
MNPEAYVEMAGTESRHWWFCARRKILGSVIETMGLPHHARILEVGSGTGGNLTMLSQHGNVSALEMDENARKLSSDKTHDQFAIHAGSCPDNIPFQDERFDLICMFDVLEHIDEDVETLAALRRYLAPGGRMLITVPAYQWLWSAHDVFLHHKRRYTARTLREAFHRSGLRIDRLTYFNTLLLPLAALARLKDRASSRKKASGTEIPPPFINSTLNAIFASERHMLANFNLPAGVSLLGIVRAE